MSTGVFADVTLSWENVDYVIKSDRVFGAIARVEEIITLVEIHQAASQGGAFKMNKISTAFCSLLQYAGAPDELTPEIVYRGMFTGADLRKNTMASITALMMLMIPPSAARLEAAKPGEQPRRAVGTRARRSSRRRTS